jgi:threonine dehydratase
MERRPTAEGVIAAADRVRPWVTRTPLLPLDWDGQRIWVKAECLQQGGAFKLRGATNRLMQLTADERARGVVAFSSGNHAIGVARAARRLGIAAIIVMPSNAPEVKKRTTSSLGARIVEYDRMTESREEIAASIARIEGSIVVPSFDDVDIIEGQGTAGVELAEQMLELAGGPADHIVVPCGGGGLAAGTALSNPESAVEIAEPEGWDDMRRSLEEGHIVPVGANPPQSRCDALQTPLVSSLTFDVLKARGAKACAVTEAEVERAVWVAFNALRIVVEPGGAVALAAVLAGKAAPGARRCAVVVSGGNVDPAVYAEILKAQATEAAR